MPRWIDVRRGGAVQLWKIGLLADEIRTAEDSRAAAIGIRTQAAELAGDVNSVQAELRMVEARTLGQAQAPGADGNRAERATPAGEAAEHIGTAGRSAARTIGTVGPSIEAIRQRSHSGAVEGWDDTARQVEDVCTDAYRDLLPHAAVVGRLNDDLRALATQNSPDVLTKDPEWRRRSTPVRAAGHQHRSWPSCRSDRSSDNQVSPSHQLATNVEGASGGLCSRIG